MISISSVANMSFYVGIVLLANLTNARLYLVVALRVLNYVLDIVKLQHTTPESGWPLQSKKKMFVS